MLQLLPPVSRKKMIITVYNETAIICFPPALSVNCLSLSSGQNTKLSKDP